MGVRLPVLERADGDAGRDALGGAEIEDAGEAARGEGDVELGNLGRARDFPPVGRSVVTDRGESLGWHEYGVSAPPFSCEVRHAGTDWHATLVQAPPKYR